MLPTRRNLLQKGLIGGALLVAGGVGLGLLAGRRGPHPQLPPRGLQALDPLEYGVVAALAARLIPARPGFPWVDGAGVATRADQLLAGADPGAQREVKALLRLFENGVTQLLFGLRPAPFSGLDPQGQEAVIRDWIGSRLLLRRTGINALRGLVMAAYYSAPASWGALGYPGPPAGFHDPEAPQYRGGSR